jgi:hypothetical protein
MMIQKFLHRNIDYNLRMMNPVGRLGLAVVEVTANRSTEQLAAECLQLLNT